MMPEKYLFGNISAIYSVPACVENTNFIKISCEISPKVLFSTHDEIK